MNPTTRVLKGKCTIPAEEDWVVTNISSEGAFFTVQIGHCEIHNSKKDGVIWSTLLFPYMASKQNFTVSTDSDETTTTMLYMPYTPIPIPRPIQFKDFTLKNHPLWVLKSSDKPLFISYHFWGSKMAFTNMWPSLEESNVPILLLENQHTQYLSWDVARTQQLQRYRWDYAEDTQIYFYVDKQFLWSPMHHARLLENHRWLQPFLITILLGAQRFPIQMPCEVWWGIFEYMDPTYYCNVYKV